MRLNLPDLLKTSIQAKVSAVVVAAVLSAVTLTALTSAFREADKRFLSKRAEIEGIAAALSAGVAYPLAQRNTADVGRTLSAMRNIPEIAFAQVIDVNGSSIVQFGNSIVLERPDQRVSPNTELGLFSTLFLRNYILETPVVSSGAKIGTLRIIANVSSLKSALAESMVSALLAGAIAAGLGLLLAQRLQRTITAPINRLTEAIQDIRGSQNYDLAVERTSKDETGLMVDAFNDMLGQIRARDQRLAQHRDRLELEVEERTSELKEATIAAQTANAAKSEFLATMSHEIRTPLNGMLVMAELLSTGDLPDRMQRHADVIVSSGQSLLAIINDILDLSKIEAGRLELEKIPVEPATVADQVMSLFAARAASQHIDLACYVSPSVPARIAADPVRLNQILANLVNNALKFTEQGSVTLRIEAEQQNIAIGAACRLRFSVIDTGIGIAEDKLEAIFDPFSQADQSTTRRFGGTGIGLSISKKLVAAMDGAISVSSEVGKGSNFSFTILSEVVEPVLTAIVTDSARRTALIVLPQSATRTVLADMVRDLGYEPIETDDTALPVKSAGVPCVVFADPAAVAKWPLAPSKTDRPRIVLIANVGDVSSGVMIDDGRADDLILRPLPGRDVRAALELAATPGTAPRTMRTRANAQSHSAGFPGVHVLAADDNAINREVLAEALGRLGIKLTLVEDGKSAVDAAAASSFDLIFMDCSMPVLDGYAATRAIRAREAEAGDASVPIIALTAHVAGMHAGAWRDAGMNDTLSKPFTLKGLTACLKRWLDASRHVEGAVAASDSDVHTQASNAADQTPVLNLEVLDDIRQMQGPGGDLVERIIGLYRLHAPAALERLATAIGAGDAVAVAEQAHALKSLCRNIGALRLGDLLHRIEYDSREGTVPHQAETIRLLKFELESALNALAGIEAQTDGVSRAVA